MNKNNQNIFLSYSHSNKNIVWKIADRLQKIFTIWIDRDYLKGGKVQSKEISNGVNNATLFIPFISDEYCNSDACGREFFLAKENKKIILPIMLVRKASNGVDVKIARLTTFYAFKPPETFDPWSEDLFKKLLNNILDLTQDAVQLASNFNDLNIK